MIPGARILKTGISVAITMYICRLLNLELVVFGAVSAVINIQPSMRLTLNSARDQVIVHILGVGVAFILGFTMGGSPLTMGLAAAIIIWIYQKLKLQHGILMGIVAAVFVMNSPPEQFVSHSIDRTGVIFVGLVVATAVNFLLFRPQYKERLIGLLRTYNLECSEFFTSAVKSYISLEQADYTLLNNKFNALNQMLSECRKLVTLYTHENFREESDVTGEIWLERAKAFIEYNGGLMERAKGIFEMLPVRNDRRGSVGELPLSAEFKMIMDILDRGCQTVERVNHKLRMSICDQLDVEAEPISEDYWEQLGKAVDQWQFKFTGSYYLHALLELSIVAADIRWAARQGKSLMAVKAKS